MKVKEGLITLMLVSSIILVSCGEEDEVVENIEVEDVQEEKVDPEEYRIKGDRVNESPVLEEDEREKRVIKQYELIDRPIIMNTIKHIYNFDEEHEESFEGVRLITSKSEDKLKVEKLAEYQENLGNTINEGVANIYDIGDVYPYVEDDFKSYYQTVVDGLANEVLYRTEIYDSIDRAIKGERFDDLRGSKAIRGLKDVTKDKDSLIEQFRPYIQEMDNIIKEKRELYGMEEVEYVKVKEEVEEVAKYKVPERVTLQEIKDMEIEDDFYGKDKEEDSVED